MDCERRRYGKEFLTDIDERCRNAEAVAIAFETYQDISLKYTTRKNHEEKEKKQNKFKYK